MMKEKKRWIKKIAALLLIFTLVFSTTGCGSENDSKKIESDMSMADDVQKYVDKVDEEFAYDVAYTLAYDEKYLSNKMGFRTSGSDAEHAAADYLADVMKEIGLEEIEKVPVKVDKWQFNDASLSIGGWDETIMPASYAASGTEADGITAEIVDVGNGKKADYEGKDVKGKIVLAGIDQWNDQWISTFLQEAYIHGASAIITYNTGGYATISDDATNMQNIAQKDLIPCVSISKAEYDKIAEQIKNGNTKATLKVDNIIERDKGESYNVIGKIKGKSSDQQIVMSGHYDVYFNGFQDDSCAVGLLLSVAKSMKDSGYMPENDLVFVCHAAEEWGASGTPFDWTTGAWEMVHTAHPEWAGKTLAMINFELPALYDGMDQAEISCVPEFADLVSDLNDTKLVSEPTGNIYSKGLSDEYVPVNTNEDGISYRAAGIPYLINIPGMQEGEKGWMQQRYHTKYDDEKTYNKDVMTYNLKNYGMLMIYIDQTPALKLSFTDTVDQLREAFDKEYAEKAGIDADAYIQKLDEFETVSKKLDSKISDINNRYEKAVSDGADEDKLEAIRNEGTQLNKTTLEAFKTIQNELIGTIGSYGLVIKHEVPQQNAEILNSVADALKKGILTNKQATGALDIIGELNGSLEYINFEFSSETADAMKKTYLPDNEDGLYWGTDKSYPFAEIGDLTKELMKISESKKNDVDFSSQISVCQKAMSQQLIYVKDAMTREMNGITKLCMLLK